MPKIVVYTIALNEAKFVERWANSAKDADRLMVVDTGSTDQTVELLHKHNVAVPHISVKPWRFDDARNAALNLLPTDIDAAISLDMDEVLTPGWRDKVESAWETGCNRLKYGYVWSWLVPGVPDMTFLSDKIHGRFTHRWICPIHEILTPTVEEKICVINDVIIEHHPDKEKSRGQYLNLLELSVKESPDNDRNSHYLAREYFFHSRWDEAIREFKRHLSLKKSTWTAERSASMRYIAKCCECLNNTKEADLWYLKAIIEDGESREALIDAAGFYLRQKRFNLVVDLCDRALMLPTTGGLYLNERYALQEGAYDILSVAYFYLGHKKTALKLAQKTIDINPHFERYQKNFDMISNAVQSSK